MIADQDEDGGGGNNNVISYENEKKLIAELKIDEGVRKNPYFDTKGIKTVGVGHNLLASPLPSYWTFPLSEQQIDYLLYKDLANVYSDLNKNLPWWINLDDVRKRVLCNMCFNLGINKLLKFKKTLESIKIGDYNKASIEMMDSLWAKQVGKRAKRLCDLILS